MKGYKLVWSISLLSIALLTIFFTITSSVEIDLPDNLTRLLGILDLCAVVVLMYTSVKLKVWKKNDNK